MTAEQKKPESQLRVKTVQTNTVEHARPDAAKRELIELINNLSDEELKGFRAATITLVM